MWIGLRMSNIGLLYLTGLSYCVYLQQKMIEKAEESGRQRGEKMQR